MSDSTLRPRTEKAIADKRRTAELARSKNNWDAAATAYGDIYALLTKEDGADPRDVRNALYWLGCCEHAAGNFAEAAKARQELWQQRRDALGPQDPSTIRALGEHADSMAAYGNWEAAHTEFATQLMLWQAVAGDHDDRTVKAEISMLRSQAYAEQPGALSGLQTLIDELTADRSASDSLTLEARLVRAEVLKLEGNARDAASAYVAVAWSQLLALQPNVEVRRSLATGVNLAAQAGELDWLGEHVEDFASSNDPALERSASAFTALFTKYSGLAKKKQLTAEVVG